MKVLHVLVVQRDAVRRCPSRYAVQRPNQSSSVSEPFFAECDAVIPDFVLNSVTGSERILFFGREGWLTCRSGRRGPLQSSPDL